VIENTSGKHTIFDVRYYAYYNNPMKTHYTLLELSQGWRYVGDDWELGSDNTT